MMETFNAILSYPKGSSFYDERTSSFIPAPMTLGEIPDLSSEQHEVMAAVLGEQPTPSEGKFEMVAFFRVLDESYSPNPMTVFVGKKSDAQQTDEEIDREVAALEYFMKARAQILAKGNASAASVVFQSLLIQKGTSDDQQFGV